MRQKLIYPVLAILLCWGPQTARPQTIESRLIPVKPGDTLAIQNDSGRVRIRPSDASMLEIRIQRVAGNDAGKPAPEVSLLNANGTVSLKTTFSGTAGEAVHLDILAPRFLNLTVSGANPDVDAAGVEGSVRIEVSGGRITAEDLPRAAALISAGGEITCRISIQPQSDLQVKTASGIIKLELTDQLQLRAALRAGGRISWDMDPMVQNSTLEKQIGSGGPVLSAESASGNVVVRLRPGMAYTAPSPWPSTPAPASQTQVRPELPRPTSRTAEAAPLPAPPPPAAATTPPPVRREPQPSPPEPAPQTRKQDATSPQKASNPALTQEAPAAAQQAPVVMDGGFALKVDVDSVFLNLSARERNSNRSVPGLLKEDFRVYEDGVKQEISHFLPTEAPFDLLLLMDVSGSTQSYLNLMKKAAIDFTRQIKPTDRVAIATFNSSVQLVENFTNDRSLAERAIQRIHSGGGTAFYDALLTCIGRYMKGVEGRKAIVVFTDGVDNQLEGRTVEGSHTTFNELYRQVQESDTIIYTIFLDTEGMVPGMTRGQSRFPPIIGGYPGGGRTGYPGGGRTGYPGSYPGSIPLPIPIPQPVPQPRPGGGPGGMPGGRGDPREVYEIARNQLNDIAEQTGGRMYSPRRIEELSGVYTEIAEDLRVQYQLAYNSNNREEDGGWREIRVDVTGRSDIVVRTRKGYFARKGRNTTR